MSATMPPPPPSQQTVAVVGLGAMGIVTVKNLLEEGFDVTGFERSSYVGGIWHFTEDKSTLSVLSNTRTNVTVDRGCYTDYPFSQGTPPYCSAKDMESYLESYVDHFGIRPRCQLGTAVTSIAFQDDTDKWRLDFEKSPPKYFDKVAVARGPHAKPVMPEIPGASLFEGPIVHSRAFKTPEDFRGQRVLVVGLGNTTGDVVEELVGVAESVSISHKRGAVIIPRTYRGAPVGRAITQRRLNAQSVGDRYCPQLTERAINAKARSLMLESFGSLDPSWGLEPSPSVLVSTPVVSDTLVPHLRSGAVGSVPGIQRVAGPSQVELSEGTKVEADAIICCTGYQIDFAGLERRFDPSADPPPAWLAAPGSKGRPLPRLYQNVFSLQRPQSLAFVGCAWFATGALCLADLTSMCIAQVWAGKSTLPGAESMNAWADAQEQRVCRLAQSGSPVPATVAPGEWLAWADRTAGAGVVDRLGWGWAGWKFWWQERELWVLLMDGVLTAAVWRLFDEGKRRSWDGAREAIERLNEEARTEMTGQDSE